jgi:Protein of unknown function (DUF1579)
MTRTALLVCTLFTVAGLSAHADDKKPADKSKAPDTAAMMAAYMKYATPGEGHKKLEPLVGSWTFTGKFWMDPSAPPTEGKGTAERKWILDGRFVQETVKGQMTGMPTFEGFAITGYDNVQKKYVGFWIDSMGTSMSNSTGSMDAAGKVYTGEHEDFDPAMGKKIKVKDVLRFESKDKQTITSYRIEDGKEVKMMELTLTRVK